MVTCIDATHSAEGYIFDYVNPYTPGDYLSWTYYDPFTDQRIKYNSSISQFPTGSPCRSLLSISAVSAIDRGANTVDVYFTLNTAASIILTVDGVFNQVVTGGTGINLVRLSGISIGTHTICLT